MTSWGVPILNLVCEKMSLRTEKYLKKIMARLENNFEFE